MKRQLIMNSQAALSNYQVTGKGASGNCWVRTIRCVVLLLEYCNAIVVVSVILSGSTVAAVLWEDAAALWESRRRFFV